MPSKYEFENASANTNNFSVFYRQNTTTRTTDLRSPPKVGDDALDPQHLKDASSATTYDTSKTTRTSSTSYGHAANSLLATIDFSVGDIRKWTVMESGATGNILVSDASLVERAPDNDPINLTLQMATRYSQHMLACWTFLNSQEQPELHTSSQG